MAGKNVETKRMGNFDMASAGDRLLAFWENYPDGKISIERNDYDGSLVYKAFIWKKKSTYLEALATGAARDLVMESADAIAEARNEAALAKKDFEKLQTISIGRALAVLGFLKDGRVASDEELELWKDKASKFDANEYAQQKQQTLDAINQASDIDVLQEVWKNAAKANVRLINDEELVAAKDAMKDKFTKPKKKASK